MLRIYGVPFSVHTRKVIITAIEKKLPYENEAVIPFNPPPGWSDSPMWGTPVLRILAAICLVFAVSNELHGQAKRAGAPPSQVDEWRDYRDRYGLIHTVKVENGEPSTGNGLLYTAYARVSMQLRSISYDKDQIAEAIRNSQVRPGLFGRGPSKLNDQNAHDDYRGLGAIAAICGLRHVANDILKYGRGPDQLSGASVLGLNNVDFGPFGEEVRQCTFVFL